MNQQSADSLKKFQESITSLKEIIQAGDSVSVAGNCFPDLKDINEKTCQEKFKMTAKSVYDTVTKFSLAYTDNPSVESCQPLAVLLEKSLVGLVGGYQLQCTVSGSTLKKYLKQSTERILSTCYDLSDALISNPSQCPQLIGIVWNITDNIYKGDLSNEFIIKKYITNELDNIQDAFRELEEALEESNESDTANEGFINDFDQFGEQFDSLTLTKKDIIIVPKVISFVKCLYSLLQKLPKFISNFVSIENLEELLNISKLISSEVDTMSSSVYPPQNISQIKNSSKILLENISKSNEILKQIIQDQIKQQGEKNKDDVLKKLEMEEILIDLIQNKLQNLTIEFET